MALLVMVHALAAAIWVGGMFVAYLAVRPAALALDEPQRLALWRGIHGRFFPWVWASVAALLLSGYLMLFWGYGGFAGAGVHIHIMQLTGLIMMALFAHLFFAPWKRLKRALDGGDQAAAGRSLGQIRLIVLINLILGLITVAVGSSGRWWGI